MTALRHLFFIGACLAVSSLALAATPLYLALGHVPVWHDALMLSWLVVPLIAAAHVSNTGDLAAGEALTSAAWIGLAWTGLAGSLCDVGTAAMLLLLVMLEAGTSPRTRYTIPVAAAATVSLVVLIGLAEIGVWAAPGRAGPVIIGLACVQAVVSLLRGRAIMRAGDAASAHEGERFRILSEAVGDLVLRYDRSGHVLAATGAAERLFGLAATDMLGRGFFERVHVADRPAFLHTVNEAARDHESVTVNLRFRLSSIASIDGLYTEPVFAWIELRTRPIVDTVSTAETVVVAAVRNITDRVQHEADIEGAKRQAEQANAAKDRFIATVSHELRTPLNAIIGFAEMLASPTLAPQDAGKRQDYADIIRTSGHHLLAVVNSLLDLSKLDAGKFEICCEPFEVASLVDACCDMVSLRAATGGIELRRQVEPGVEPLVGDRRACKQILLNLLSNALKFTRPGGRVVVLARPDGNALLLSVSDTGIGMAPRDLAKLGDPFFQARGDYDRPYEGTGLGLSVVKGLVGLHGGTIAVDSAPGEGTTVMVRLPLDARRPQRPLSGKIEVITRTPRPGGAHPSAEERGQKIA